MDREQLHGAAQLRAETRLDVSTAETAGAWNWRIGKELRYSRVLNVAFFFVSSLFLDSLFRLIFYFFSALCLLASLLFFPSSSDGLPRLLFPFSFPFLLPRLFTLIAGG